MEAKVLFKTAEAKAAISERAYDPDLPELGYGKQGGRLWVFYKT